MKANIVGEIRSMQAEIDSLERGLEVILLNLLKPGAITLKGDNERISFAVKKIIELQKKAGVYPEKEYGDRVKSFATPLHYTPDK
ncbi:MAG: hypothetical protein ABFC84_13345 [Veillonellales bacterium]